MRDTKKRQNKKQENRIRTGKKDIGKTIKKIKWKYAEHVARSNKGKWIEKTLDWMSYNGERKKWRFGTRWRDEIVKKKE